MRTLQLVGWYPPRSMGGTEVYVASLVRELRALGVESEVGVRPTAGETAAWSHEGTPVVPFPPGADGFARWLRERAADIVHIHSFTEGLGGEHVAAARRIGIPVVVTVHLPDVLCAVFCLAVVTRGLLLMAALAVRGEPLDVFLSRSDAGSYLGVASRIYGGEAYGGLEMEYHERVFPGWPLLFGWSTPAGIPAAVAVMTALAILLAGAVPLLYRRLPGAGPESWLLAVFPPAWVIHSTYPMGEALFLTACLAACLASTSAVRRHGAAGAAAALAALVRPHGIFAVAAVVAVAARRDGWAGAARSALPLGLAAVGLVALNTAMWGDPLRQVHAYARPLAEMNLSPGEARALGEPRGHLGWPLHALLSTPLHTGVSPVKLAYVYLHAAVLIVLVLAAARSLVRWRRLPDTDLFLALWLAGGGGAALCGGPYWGFHSFDRYAVAVLPAGVWTARRALTARPHVIGALSAASLCAAAWAFLRPGGG